MSTPTGAVEPNRATRPVVVLRVRDLVKTYRLTKGVVFRRTSARCARSTASASSCGRAARWASSASPGPGSRRRCTRSWSWPRRSPGSIEVLGNDVATLSPAARRRCAATCRWCSRTRWRRWTRGCRCSMCSPSRCRPTGSTRAATNERVAELLDIVGIAPRRRQPLPGRVLRRAEAAHRHRAGAGVAAEDPRPRRAGVGARRLHPGRHHQPAARPAGAVRLVLSCSSPTTCRWSSTSPTGWR